jgi:hypothetical protein
VYTEYSAEPGLVAHACNPSYSGGRDQEDRSSKPAGANSSRDPISKKNKKRITKIGLVKWLKVSRWRPRVQTPVPPKKKTNKNNLLIIIQN